MSATHDRTRHVLLQLLLCPGPQRLDLALIDTLASSDPFALPPAEVLERVLALGNIPDITHAQSQMCSTVGRVFEVRREDRDFLVAIGRDAEEISVQEIRADAYDSVE